MNKELYYYLYILLKFIDKCIDIVIRLIFICIFIYGCYGLYDTYNIYYDNGLNNQLIMYKDSVEEQKEEGFKLLNLVNEDICGWLSIEDTHIHYPILQGKDNSTYINRNYEGEYSLLGSVFLDYRNSNDFSDQYSLLYAHSMEGNRMFGELPQYLDYDYFNNHLNGQLFIENQLYYLDIFACMIDSAYNNLLYKPHQITDKTQLLDYIKTHAKQYRDIAFYNDDCLLAMSTCSTISEESRVLVFARIRKEVVDHQKYK